MKINFDDKLQPVTESPTEITMEQRGILGGLERFKIGDAPIGHALLGGTTATLVSEVIDGVAPNLGMGNTGSLVPAVIKIIAAGFLAKPLAGVVGKPATDAALLFLTYDAVRDIIPLDNWIRNFFPGGGGSVATEQSMNVGNGTAADVTSWLQSQGAR